MAEKKKGVSLDPFQRIVGVGWRSAWSLGFAFVRGPEGAGWGKTEVIVRCNGGIVAEYDDNVEGVFFEYGASRLAPFLLPEQTVVTLAISYSQHATGTPGKYGLTGWGETKGVFNTADTVVNNFSGIATLSATYKPPIMIPSW